MRLRDLDAEFVGTAHTENGSRCYTRQDSIAGAQGLIFQCPKCAEGKERGEEDGRGHFKGAHYVLCWFRNPIGAEPVPADWTPGPGRWWVESGSTIDDITFGHGVPPMAKSVLLTAGCGWHGFVERGEARTG